MEDKRYPEQWLCIEMWIWHWALNINSEYPESKHKQASLREQNKCCKTNSIPGELLTSQRKKKMNYKSCCSVAIKPLWANKKVAPEWALKRAEAKQMSHIFSHEYKTTGKGGTKDVCRSTLNFSPTQPKVLFIDKPRVFYEKREVFELRGNYIWQNMIWRLLGHLMSTKVPFALSNYVRKLTIVWVNRQRCIRKGELLLQTLLNG